MAALDDGIKFADFDITLTDRELEDFLSFMEHQTTGGYADALPQLPDVAMDFPGLQLQPHSGSPSNSEGSESIGVGASGAAAAAAGSGCQPPFAPSSGSLNSAGVSSPINDAAANTSMSDQLQQQQALLLQAPAQSTPMDALPEQLQPQPQQQQQLLEQQQFQQQQARPMDIKIEPGMDFQRQQHFQQQPYQQPTQVYCNSPMPTVVAVSAGSAAASAVPTLAGALAASGSAPAALPLGGVASLATSQPQTLCIPAVQWHSSTAAAAADGQQQVQQPIQQLVFVQGPALAAVQQQQQPLPMNPAVMSSQSSMNAQAVPAAAAAAAGASWQAEQQMLAGAHVQSAAAAGGSGGRGNGSCRHPATAHRSASNEHSGGKVQVSHSTVEKQRRDRLNSLIDELSDIVPPADPKYGNEANSVRRPKHVVLADTINLLKAMQTKLQIEEAEICTLKQQAAAVAAMAAQHQAGHAAGQAAAEAMMHAAATASPPHQQGGVGGGCAAAAGAADGGSSVQLELPMAPESGSNSTGVLVEQGIGCLYVKLNCKDRKGLLSDVVTALKGLPVVISTAAITTTKDGKVHDVFEVRIEDGSVTAEDVQCAVHQALFAAQQARSKRVRRDSASLQPEQ